MSATPFPEELHRFSFKILGRPVGSTSGDQDIWWYDFQPDEGIPIPACATLFFSWDTGTLKAKNDDGTPIGDWDAAVLLGPFPRRF